MGLNTMGGLPEDLFTKVDFGIAYHKIIFDKGNDREDFEILDANPAFEKLTGLRLADLAGKNSSELLIRKPEHHSFIRAISDIIQNSDRGKESHFLHKPTNKWLQVKVELLNNAYFYTFIIDITAFQSDLTSIMDFLKYSGDILQTDDYELDFQKITDDFLKLTKAKYVFLNLYNEDNTNFSTIALSGDRGNLLKAADMLGFRLRGKKWKHDPLREKKIQDSVITHFKSLSQLAESVLPKTILSLLESTFSLGETVLVKILSGELMLGDFTVVMDKYDLFTGDELIENYSRQLGVMIQSKRTEDDLFRQKAWFKGMTDNSFDIMSFLSKEGIILYQSNAIQRVLGYPHDEISGKSVFDFIHPNDRQKMMSGFLDLINSPLKTEIAEFRFRHNDGTWKWLEASGQNFLFDPYLKGILINARDISAQKEAAQQLLDLNEKLSEQSFALKQLNESLEIRVKKGIEENRKKDHLMALQARHAAMGEMIANIAHQWRQPLNTINLIVWDLMEAFKNKELSDDAINDFYLHISNILQHMSHTIDDFRNFFSPLKEKKDFMLDEVIRNAVTFLAANFRNQNIKVNIKCSKKIEIRGYPNELVQVIINILNNARDVFLENNIEDRLVTIRAYNKGKTTFIVIENNGGHISTNNLEKIFDPYYTTKKHESGTGLGLYISKTIIEKNMNGRITAENSGTRDVIFTIELGDMS